MKNGVGYDHSIWATPVIEYTTIDGQTYVLDCFIDENLHLLLRRLVCFVMQLVEGS